ncbi:hypothetical protein B5807_01135 [Epicoccum nigrum]|uniref:Uncharacterized protein n=1 Tax=Epicoccum nigrum TaxID=105696 RepID=A0A1Y2MDM5_EPING|nr:hypothetical protein B5807_01135 [Epicoccum nigrum]
MLVLSATGPDDGVSEGVEVTMEVVRERRGRSPRRTAVWSVIITYIYMWGGGGLTVHEHRLGDIVRIVSSHNVPDAQPRCTTVQRLSPEHSAIRAVPLLAHLLHHLVHSPPIQLRIPQDRQRHVVLLRVPLDRLQTIVSVPFDALVDRQQHEIQPVVVALVQCFEYRSQHRRVLAARSADGDALAALEQVGREDGVVDFRLEHVDEARLAQLGVVLWAQDERAVGLAHGTYRGRHSGRFARCGAWEGRGGVRRGLAGRIWKIVARVIFEGVEENSESWRWFCLVAHWVEGQITFLQYSTQMLIMPFWATIAA